jgi:hypothetical protein
LKSPRNIFLPFKYRFFCGNLGLLFLLIPWDLASKSFLQILPCWSSHMSSSPYDQQQSFFFLGWTDFKFVLENMWWTAADSTNWFSCQRSSWFSTILCRLRLVWLCYWFFLN